jgi:hypothetical protein
MPVYGVVAGLIAWFLLTFVGASFMIAPEKANQWFGTLATQGESPLTLRLGGLLFIFAVLFIALMIVEEFSRV